MRFLHISIVYFGMEIAELLSYLKESLSAALRGDRA